MLAKGVEPNDVIRDPRAEALFLFLTLKLELGTEQAQEWLRQLTAMIRNLEEPQEGLPGTAVVGFGRSFFVSPDGSPRFGLGEQTPFGLRTPAGLQTEEPGFAADIVIYAMAPEEEALTNLVLDLSRTKDVALQTASYERGFQRRNRRELFGFLDGERNVPRSQRHRVIYVDRERFPEEPQWCEDGTYVAYMKIVQDLARLATLPEEEQERIMGRRKKDGSRPDQPPGTDPHTEPEFASGEPAPNSHVRKSGPRGPVFDEIAIFRRGVPFASMAPDGSVDGGLQFVSFQCTRDHFEVVLRRWMLNAEFPSPGSGPDRLFAENLVRVRKGDLFFVPPFDEEFIGAPMFRPTKPEPRPRETGKLHIRKHALNPDGSPSPADLSGVGFQVFKSDGTTAIGDPFVTNPAGHAVSGELPVNEALVLREVQTPNHLESSGDTQFQLDRRNQPIDISNRAKQPGTYS